MNNFVKPELHLSFDELITVDDDILQVHDLSSKNHHAQVIGRPAIVPDDRFGSCIFFDQSDQALALDPRFSPQLPFSMNFWVAMDDINSTQCFLSFLEPDQKCQFWLGVEKGQFRIQFGNHVQLLDQSLMAAQKWVHINCSLEEKDGNCQIIIYLNDEVLQSFDAGEVISFAADGQWQVGGSDPSKTGFSPCKMGDLYIFQEIIEHEMRAHLLGNTLTVQSAFAQTFPLSFELQSEGVRNTLYISQASKSTTQHFDLVITNSGSQALAFHKLNDGEFHFDLNFRPMTLDENPPDGEADWTYLSAKGFSKDWQVGRAEVQPDGVLRISFAYKGTKEFVLPPDQSMTFSFAYYNANGKQGNRNSQVVLSYQHMIFEAAKTPIEGIRNQMINVVNHLGSKEIPLYLGFVGSHTVLNYSSESTAAEKTTSEVILRLLNTLPEGQLRIQENAEFILSFDSPGSARALAKKEELKTITVEPVDSWGVVRGNTQGTKVQFKITEINKVLEVNGYLDIKLSNIRTSKPSGLFNIYLDYKNIPGFWDGQLALQGEKSPIVHHSTSKEKCVGIGVKPLEKYRLAIGGNLKVEAHPSNDNVLHITDKNNQKNYLTIKKEGQVLIGDGNSASNVNVNGEITATGSINTSKKIQENGHDLLPSGAIIMWHGSTIPKGWAICDGNIYDENKKTPDLTGKFVVGVGRAKDDNGSYDSHTYKFKESKGKSYVTLSESEMPKHKHTISSAGSHSHSFSMRQYKGGPTSAPYHGGDNTSSKTGSTNSSGYHNHGMDDSGEGKSHENRPPYYALYYIMKL